MFNSERIITKDMLSINAICKKMYWSWLFLIIARKTSVKDHLRSVPEICFFLKKNRFSIDLRLRPKFLVSGSKFCHGAESGVKKFLARLKRALSDFESPKTRSEPYQNRPKVVFQTCSFLHGIFSQT